MIVFEKNYLRQGLIFLHVQYNDTCKMHVMAINEAERWGVMCQELFFLIFLKNNCFDSHWSYEITLASQIFNK